MTEYQLVVITGSGRNVLARVAGMAIPFDIEIIGIHLSPAVDADEQWLQMSVDASSKNRLEFLVKRLNRMVDVTKVLVLEPDAHHRQSVYVMLHPRVPDLLRVWGVIQTYDAETLEVTEHSVLVHLNAAPDRCAAFAAELEPFNVVESVTGTVASFRAGLRRIGHINRPTRVSVRPSTGRKALP